MRGPAANRVASVACLLALAWPLAATAAERGFPKDGEFLLEAKPMKGSKRIPMVEFESQEGAAFELWCNRVHARFVVVGTTVTIILDAPSPPQYAAPGQCDPDRVQADEDLVAALQQVESWQRQDDLLVLQGPQALRFRLSSH
jgi:hypothetical protein